MWEKEKRDIHDLDIEVIIHIKSRDDIIGMLLLTRKKNNTAYTLDDLDLLSYLGASTAVAFENARLYTRSQSEALTDSLTKLYNHRYFCKALSEQVAKVGSAELSILMIDLDLFKLFNDLYGHVEGDNALEMVASIMVRIVGQKGIVCRYGGEEFVVLLPETESAAALALAERLRSLFEAQETEMSTGEKIRCTISIGVSQHVPTDSENTLIRRADNACYVAKERGRNCVELEDSGA